MGIKTKRALAGATPKDDLASSACVTGIQVARSRLFGVSVAIALVALAGCGRSARWRARPAAPAPDAKAEAAYLAPPQVLAGARAGAGIVVNGSAAPGARVRLGTPAGQAHLADADAKGGWRLQLPDGPDVQIYGLSMILAGRTVQSEGYVAVLPSGRVVRLRAGAGALVLGSSGDRLRITAVDFDRDGGAMVSGLAKPGANLMLRIGGVDSPGVAGPDGRFSIAAKQPMPPGPQQVLVGGDGEAVLSVDAARAPALGAKPMRAVRLGGGWRIDWMTPGGGVQTTVIAS